MFPGAQRGPVAAGFREDEGVRNRDDRSRFTNRGSYPLECLSDVTTYVRRLREPVITEIGARSRGNACDTDLAEERVVSPNADEHQIGGRVVGQVVQLGLTTGHVGR